MNGDFNNGNDLSWLLFASSGQIGYYMLHKNLMNEENGEEEDYPPFD